MPAVARILKDTARELLKSSPQTTVFVNDAPFVVATEGSVTVKGDMVVASNVTVYIQDKKVAVQGAMMASGAAIGKSSPDVDAGNVGP
jgi:uncharacterized Zn-binding protein involved in type VI secretion